MSVRIPAVGVLPVRRLVAGLAGGALVTAGSLIETTTYRGTPPALVVVPLVVLVLGAVLAPLLPVVGLLAAALAFPLQALFVPGVVGIGGTSLVTMMVLVGLGASRLSTAVSAPGAVLTVIGAAGANLLVGESIFELLFFSATMGGAWLVGRLLRRERRRSAELRRLARELALERERSERLVLSEERTRISRELHDAVAHSVSVMTLQVGVVRRRLARGVVEEHGAECTALLAVEDLGRRSVDELRRVVGALRDERPDDHGSIGPARPTVDPGGSVSELDDLVARLDAVGLTVSVRVEGVPVPLAPAMDSSAHRVVAEALTNVLRHAGVDRAEVVVRWTASDVVVEILDRGTGPAPGPAAPDSGGHGLLTMRERARLAGGTLEAGPRPGGGFRVGMVLPLGAAAVAVGVNE